MDIAGFPHGDECLAIYCVTIGGAARTKSVADPRPGRKAMNRIEPGPARLLRLTEADDVAVALQAVPAGAELHAGGPPLLQAVPAGHKVAVRDIAAGAAVRKFGQIIGWATEAIPAGTHVHVHNCTMGDHERDAAIGADYRATVPVAEGERAWFMGYRRADGRAGTRNMIALCATVNCAATVVRHIADAVERSGMLDDYPEIDGIVALGHDTGCGLTPGDGLENLERVLWGHATHPNVCAALFVGLGCEVMQIARLAQKYQIGDRTRFHSLTIQESGGTRRTVEAAVARIREMLPDLARAERVPVPASELTLALQCGGSDGYSGITANPALGRAADLLVAQGGTAILAETPEIYGAEHLLVRRAASAEVGARLLERIAWWEDYTRRNNAEMNNNPSPGNKAGGLTTILEKSLGAVAKGGTTGLMDVLRYGERAKTRGFVFMDSPGYDPASVTGQIAAGATIVCFTTGRGSAFGSRPAPTLKLATNSALYERMVEDMDINCGDIVEGAVTVEQKGAEIFARILETASGAETKSESLGYGGFEYVPWQVGATM